PTGRAIRSGCLAFSISGRFDGAPAAPLLSTSQDRQVLVAAPSAAYLPPSARKVPGSFLRSVFQASGPRVSLAVDPALDNAVNLAATRKNCMPRSDTSPGSCRRATAF
ncbi:MAG: hypothetical protein ABIZ80_00135, partial [Bryobacteraceae bacterium]